MAESRRPGPGHEESDINVRAIALFAGGMILVAVVLLLSLYGLFGLYAAIYGNPPGPIATESQLPPPPRLQAQPDSDWARMKADTDRRLASYGWSDAAKGRVHIPIDRAMGLLVEQGLPVSPLPRSASRTDDLVFLKESGRALP